MPYLCIGLSIITILLITRLILLRHAMKQSIKQMMELEKNPGSNHQLTVTNVDKQLESLLKQVNNIYTARQQERIVYQRRETQIRREIENISHDLRTPLTSILGYVNLLEETDDKKEKYEYLEIIRKRAKVLQGFIQDFYELSRIEADDYPLVLERIAVQNVLTEVVLAYYAEFEKRKIQVEIDLQEEPAYIVADNIAIHRIINNLVQNALKYTEGLVKIRQYTMDKNCIVRIQNPKGSLTNQELALIFDRFYTGDPSRNNQSTGLGLTIAKILTEKMKGSIEGRIEDEDFIVELIFPER